MYDPHVAPSPVTLPEPVRIPRPVQTYRPLVLKVAALHQPPTERQERQHEGQRGHHGTDSPHREASRSQTQIYERDFIRKAYVERGLPNLIPAWKVTFKFL